MISYSHNNTATAGHTNSTKPLKKADVQLNGSTEAVAVVAIGKIIATDSTALSLTAGKSIFVTNSKVEKDVCGKKKVTVVKSEIGGTVVGKSVTLTDCPNVQKVSAQKTAVLSKSTVTESVSASSVELREATIKGNVDSTKCGSNKNVVQDSVISGSFTYCSETLELTNASIETVCVRALKATRKESSPGNFQAGDINVADARANVKGSTQIGGVNVITSGSHVDIIDSAKRGVNIISAGRGGRIENCTQISGPMSNDPELIKWVLKGGDPVKYLQQKAKQTDVESKEESKRQILVLINCAVKDIIFEGEKGEVVLKGTSYVSGKVTGGQIK